MEHVELSLSPKGPPGDLLPPKKKALWRLWGAPSNDCGRVKHRQTASTKVAVGFSLVARLGHRKKQADLIRGQPQTAASNPCILAYAMPGTLPAVVVKTVLGSLFGVGEFATILVPILVGIGMFGLLTHGHVRNTQCPISGRSTFIGIPFLSLREKKRKNDTAQLASVLTSEVACTSTDLRVTCRAAL